MYYKRHISIVFTCIPVMDIQIVLHAFNSAGCTFLDFVETLLNAPEYEDHSLRVSVVESVDQIFQAFASAKSTAKKSEQSAHEIAQKTYQLQVEKLSQKEGGFHFLAKKVTEEQAKGFSIERTAAEMKNTAPDVWNLLERLLCANQHVNYQRIWSQRKAEAMKGKRKKKSNKESGEIELGDEGLQDGSDEDGDEPDDAIGEDDDIPEDIDEQETRQMEVLTTIVRA